MARIEPFKGVRPTQELAAQVAAPPYDVLNSEEARAMAAHQPFSFLHIGKPEIDLPADIDHYADAVYAKGKENFERFRQAGTIVQDTTKCFYIYKQIWGEHVQIGLVAGASAQDYLDDVIKKHELTREDKENDRLRHIETLHAQTGPVFLTYRHRDSVNRLIAEAMQAKPVNDFKTSDGVQHIFYVVNDESLIKKIKAEFAAIDFLYVADGHHRSAAATRIKVKRQKENSAHTGNEEYNFFLAVIFPDNQMKILPYNRLVKDLNGQTKEQYLKALESVFSVEKTTQKAPAQTHDFCMYMDHQWYLLRAKQGSFAANDPIESLDVSILQKNLLDPLLGIKNPRTDKRIDFVGGIRGTAELEKRVDSGECAVAISMYPTTIEQLFSVADSGKIMPPKSTWFEPKLKDGVVVHMIDA